MHPQEAQAEPQAENAVHHAAAVIAREKVSREAVPDDSRESRVLVVPPSNGDAGGTCARRRSQLTLPESPREGRKRARKGFRNFAIFARRRRSPRLVFFVYQDPPRDLTRAPNQPRPTDRPTDQPTNQLTDQPPSLPIAQLACRDTLCAHRCNASAGRRGYLAFICLAKLPSPRHVVQAGEPFLLCSCARTLSSPLSLSSHYSDAETRL